MNTSPRISCAIKLLAIASQLQDQNRFFLNPMQLEYFNEMIDFITGSCRRMEPQGTILYRARIMNKKPRTIFSDEDMLGPPPELATDGRLNPRGMPYLYMSLKDKTCIFECRPWIGVNLTLAEFKLTKNINIIDLTSNKQSETETHLPWDIALSNEFSKPVTNDMNYLTTQYISERIKILKYDGVKYRSSIDSEGFNLVLFSNTAVEIVSKQIVSINKIHYDYSPFYPNKNKIAALGD